MSETKEKKSNGLSVNRRKFLKLSAFASAAVGVKQMIGPFHTPSALPLQ
jgi:hypothetical protein